ncbi:unnamed protein product [Arctogadus glacialis]
MAKNCDVDGTHPAFEVDEKNVNIPNSNLTGVGMVTISVYGTIIDIVHNEFGLVRVNNQLWNLPINLDNGKVILSQRGFSVVVETDFGLVVQYDWQQYFTITVPSEFAGKVCGMCGNFNGKQDDDLTIPSGAYAKDQQDMGNGWRVPGVVGDTTCQDTCKGQCQICNPTFVEQLEDYNICSALSQVMDKDFQACTRLFDPKQFLQNCMVELCNGVPMKQHYCDTLQMYSETCQRAGVPGQKWREANKCSPPKCQENSYYEHCGSSCPATCGDLTAPSICIASCVETCTCNDGFVLSGSKCIPKAQCGCLYEGRYVAVGASFWGGDTCNERFTCSAEGKLTMEKTSCPTGQQCQVVKGIRGCYAVNYATCMVSGDPHIVTFDGELYNFQGTCTYELASVSSSQKTLENFSVILQNSGQDKRTGSVVNLVEVKVYGNTVNISKEQPGFVTVNGKLSYLPMALNGTKLQLYTIGWFVVLKADFGLKVYYDWNSVAFVQVPSTYKGSMIGLCGNYNLNPKDDMQMKNGKEAATAEELGQSWQVASTPGCVNGCTGPCPGCTASQKEQYNTKTYCGLISDPTGPFRDCHSVVEPAKFLNDCIYDVCLYQGRGSMQCKTMTAYTAACQLKGAKVYPWRSDTLCDAQCPLNGHYEICSAGCQKSCQNPESSYHCGAQCMEGCICNDGFVLSGNECVPSAQCGCLFNGKYYKYGQVFYPDGQCQQECLCNGTVQCQKFSCGPNEKCEVKDGGHSCQPVGKGVCSISGDPHYNTFDNSTYDFQGTCTYTAAEACHLNGTRLTAFSVAVENERWHAMNSNPQVSVAKLVAVEVYGSLLVLRRNQIGMVMLNGILAHIPLNLNEGKVQVYQDGYNYVILTDFGLRVTYDMIYHITVTVPSNYMDHTCGLCGNFNDNNADDFTLPDGKVTKDVQSFGAAWKVAVRGVVCEDGCSGDLCPKCDDTKKEVFEKDCQVLTDPKGPFAACHNVIDPASYFRDCVYDVCMVNGDTAVLCDSIGAYMMDCQTFGVKIPTWRTPTFCPLTCPANSHYQVCGQSCDTPCPNLSSIVVCPEKCAEGCACNAGYNFNGTGCVSLDQCSCYFEGTSYKVGESIVSEDCHTIHTCQASGVVVSQSMLCQNTEICQIQNGTRGCFPRTCLLEDNGSLNSLDGARIFLNSGAFDIIQVCDPNVTDQWFRVVVRLEMCGTPAVNSIVGVHVYFTDMTFTITNHHDIWVNGKAMTESSFKKSNIALTVSGKTVTIDKDNSLQLSFNAFNDLTMSISGEMAEQVCGACGSLMTLNDKMFHGGGRLGLRVGPIAVNTDKWRAPDFPDW